MDGTNQNPQNEEDEGVWVLFEDGSLRFVPNSTPEPDIKTKPNGTRWLTLDPKSPIHPTIQEVEVEAVPVRWPDAPRFEARQWQALSFVKSISAFMAGWVLLRHARRKPNETNAQLGDIYDLIRSGHPERAIERLIQFQEDHPDHRPSIKGLMSLALHEKGDVLNARATHFQAWLEGSSHPAMQEVYGDPEFDRFGGDWDSDGEDDTFIDDSHPDSKS